MEQWEKELAEIRAIMAENARGMAQQREEHYRKIAELWELHKENEKGFAQLRKLQKENEEKSEKEWEQLSKQLGGISDRNGKVAEEFFYNSLNEIKTLGGISYSRLEHSRFLRQNRHAYLRLLCHFFYDEKRRGGCKRDDTNYRGNKNR